MTIETRPNPSIPVWAESGDKVQPTNPEIQEGWPLSNVPPSRQRFNWVLNACAQAARYLLQRGVAQWASGEDYPQNARVQHNGITYRALINSPTSAPGVVAGEWELWGFSDSTLLPRVDSILNKSVAGGVDVVLTTSEANNGILNFTGVLTANINVVVPNTARRWVVRNNTTGAFTLGVKTASGAAVAVAQGSSAALYCDGANSVSTQSVVSSSRQIQPIDATVAANALTVTVQPTTLDFRSATLASGTVNTRTLAAAASLTVPSGATLGTANGVLSRLVVLLLDNAGTLEPAIVNLAGGVNLDETGVISTTAISGAANSASVVYSQSARANLPYRVVGVVESTQATAGTWATAPSRVQGAGGQAYAAMQSLGFGQTWQDVTVARSLGTTYTNTTGRPIVVQYQVTGSAGVQPTMTIAGQTVAVGGGVNGSGNTTSCQAVIPAGATYVASSTSLSLNNWRELR